jgi:plastocyanin
VVISKEVHMRRWLIFTVIVIIALSLAGVSCGGSATTTTTTAGAATTSSQAGGAGGTQVTIQNFAYDPATITVHVGDTVTWTNKDSVNHTVTADNGEFSSDPLGQGATFSFTFTKAGSYPYHCTIHPYMTGTVVVQ